MIRIAIVDGHAVVRAGLRQFFAEHDDLCVVAEAASGRQALDIVRQAELDVMLLDMALPGQTGLDVLVAVRARAPRLPVLMLSGQADTHLAVTLLRLGASGFLGKDADPAEFVQAVRTLHGGRKFITAGTAERLAEGLACGSDKPPHDQLSDREMQVFLHLAGGQTIGKLAQGLSLSVKTVSTYRSRVMDKLLLGSNSELTYYALKNGLIQ